MVTSWGERLEERGREAGRREGREEGREEGRQEGREQGREEGLRLGRASALLELLQAKFGEVPPEVVDRVRSAGEGELGRWLAQVLRAERIEDALG
jgi:predicted transposase YdaD